MRIDARLSGLPKLLNSTIGFRKLLGPKLFNYCGNFSAVIFIEIINKKASGWLLQKLSQNSLMRRRILTKVGLLERLSNRLSEFV
jgi:hypothetical protein